MALVQQMALRVRRELERCSGLEMPVVIQM
jgi:hypothetical protein